jgi:membrane associated rhomboid family serine protease
MIPIADENPLRHKPWLVMVIIAICTLTYLGLQPGGRNTFSLRDPRIAWNDLQFSLDWATVPCEILRGRSLTQAEFDATFPTTDFAESIPAACDVPGDTTLINPNKPVYFSLFFSIFLHGSLGHLVGNMLFLWVFGNNIEDSRGRLRFFALYVIGGLLSDFAHILVDPYSTIPVVGASGAIAAVMGAYLSLYPKTRIKVITPWLGLRKVSASWVLGLWFVSQFLIAGSADSAVAWGAHVGGFVVGVLWGLWWRRTDAATSKSMAPPTLAPPTLGPPSPGLPSPDLPSMIQATTAPETTWAAPPGVNPSPWQAP